MRERVEREKGKKIEKVAPLTKADRLNAKREVRRSPLHSFFSALSFIIFLCVSNLFYIPFLLKSIQGPPSPPSIFSFSFFTSILVLFPLHALSYHVELYTTFFKAFFPSLYH